MRIKHLGAMLILLAFAVPASPAHADGVVSVCDEAHLLAALAGGGTVTFSCSGTITLTAEITIAADTTIDGSGQTVTISGNHAVRVFSVNSGVTLNLNELTVANGNAGEGRGGGIYNSGTLHLNHSTFSGNSARAGGGIWNYGTLSLSNSTFSGNDAVAGGGINSTGTSSTVIVSNSTFSDNTASLNGGGIANGSTATVSNSTFSGNHAPRGGGIDSYYRLTVSNGAFDHNQADIGGGIDNTGTVTVSNSTFLANRGTYFGGSINNWSGGRVSLSNSTFSGNSADSGGGIYNERGTVGVSNSTFSDNIAYGAHYEDGGGIYNENSGTVTVSNSTFSGNSAYGVDGEGGGIYNNDGTATLKNTIFASSPTGGNCSGTITDGGGNLSYPDTTCPGINADPMLGPIQYNLGPTETMALGPGSAAIDAGIDAFCAAAPVNGLDQRGITRPRGPHCDIGAVEQVPIKTLWLPLVRSR